MKFGRALCFLVLIATAVAALGQPWREAYERGLAAVRAQKWSEARLAFLEASKDRRGDASGPTRLRGGTVTEQRSWRDGAPYSPNFAAAYAGLKAAFAMGEPDRSTALRTVAAEFSKLLDQGQNAKETFYFLNLTYSALGDKDAVSKLEERFTKVGRRMRWKVDTEMVSPEEMAAIQTLNPEASRPAQPDRTVRNPADTASGATRTTGEGAPTQPAQNQRPSNPANPPMPKPRSNPASTSPPTNSNTIQPGSLTPSSVPELDPLGKPVPLSNKFALVVGNGQSRISDLVAPDTAANDAALIRDGLVADGGYPDANVEVVTDGSPEAILQKATALAERMPEDGAVITIFYSGVGVNLDGKDYLAGIEASSATDSGAMLAKMDLFKPFLNKGANIFAFFQVNRPVISGRTFGNEVPIVGSISQSFGTIQGGSVLGFTRNGKRVGVYANAFVNALLEFKTNKIPILEFSWQVFFRMRRGGTGIEGGGSTQTPTLPVLTNMASDARF